MIFIKSSVPIEAPLNSHDFPRVAKEMGFSFSLRRGRVDWFKIDGINIDRLVQERDLITLQANLLNVVNYNLDSEYDVKILDQNFVKLFQLAQLSVDYLLYSEQHLFNCVEILREQLAKSIEDVEKLQGDIKMKNEDIKCLKKKLKEKSHSYHPVSKNGSYFKCTHCKKMFSNQEYLSSHLFRRHSPSAVSELPELTKTENEVLRSENKQLKERLNCTDIILQHDKQQRDDKQENDKHQNEKGNKLEEMLEKLNQKYQSEITSLTSTFQNEMKRIKEAKSEDGNNHELMMRILKQDLEIQRLQEQIDGKSSPEVEILNTQVEAQERFWKSRFNTLEEKYAKEIEEMKVLLNKNDSQKMIDYEKIIEELMTRTAKQEEIMKIHEKKMLQISAQKVTNFQSSVEANNKTSALKSDTFENGKRSLRAAFRERPSRRLIASSQIQSRPKSSTFEQKPQNTVETKLISHTQSIPSEELEMETLTVPDSSQLEIKFQTRTPSSSVTQTAMFKPPLVIQSSLESVQQKNEFETAKIDSTFPITEISKSKSQKEMFLTESSSSSESIEDVEYTDVTYFPTQETLEYQHKSSPVADKQSKHLVDSDVEHFLETSTGKGTNFFSRNVPKKSASSPVGRQVPKVQELRSTQSSSILYKTNFEGTKTNQQGGLNITENLGKGDIASPSEDEESEETESEESHSTSRQSSNELALHSVLSLESALVNNPQVLEEFKLDIKQQFNERLREFGVDPEWTGIPLATFNCNMDTLDHHQTLTAKKYPSFFNLKQQLVKDMNNRLSTKLEGEGSGDGKLPKKNPSSRGMKRFDKMVGSVKRKAFGIFDRTKHDRKTEQQSSKSFVSRKVAQNQRRRNMHATKKRTSLRSRGNENVLTHPLSMVTSTPLLPISVDSHFKNATFSSSDESESKNNSDQVSNNSCLQHDNDSEKLQIYPEIHMSSSREHSKWIRAKVVSHPNHGPDKQHQANGMSKSRDFLDKAMTRQESTRSALKSSSSTGSLAKKRVLFADNSDMEPQWDSPLKNNRKTVQFLDDIAQKDLANTSLKVDDWELSSDEFETTQPSTSNEFIHFSTKQSDNIAQISRNIEQQLSRARTKPPGGVETVFQSTVEGKPQISDFSAHPSSASLLSVTSDYSKSFPHSTTTKQTSYNDSSELATLVPKHRKQNTLKTQLPREWDFEDFDNISD